MNEYDAAINLLIKARDESGPAFGTLKGNLASTKTSLDIAGAASSVFTGLMVGGAARALQTFGQAAREQEISVLRLANAVDQNGGSWARQREQIEKTIDARKRLAFSDNQLRDSLSVLTIETGNFEEAQRRQLLAMDLARAMNIDLGQASRLLGRVNEESIMGLQRLGFAIKRGTSETEALAIVQTRVAGAAERYGNSNAGAADKIANGWHDIEASVGTALGPISMASATLQGLPLITGSAASAFSFFTKQISVGGVQMTNFAKTTQGLASMLPSLGRGFGIAALLAGEFFGIMKLAEAGGKAGIPFLDQFSNKQGTGSMDMFLKIVESKGLIGALGLLKDEIFHIAPAAETASQAVDRLRGALGKYPDILAEISDKMRGKGGGGLSRAGGAAAAIVKELQDTFGGVGGIAGDDPVFAKIDDILNNVIGLTPEAKYKEFGDQLYKRIHDKVQGELVDPLQKIKDDIDKGGDPANAALKAYAGEHGIKPDEALKAFTQEFADAQKRLADVDNEVKGLINRGAAGQETAIKAFHATQKSLISEEKLAVMELAAEYDALNAQRAGQRSAALTGNARLADLHSILLGSPGGGTGAIDATQRRGERMGQLGLDQTFSQPTWLKVGEQGTRERVIVKPEGMGGREHGGASGAVFAPGAIVLNYGGSADKSAAARLANDVVDNVIEAIRQGTRRLGDRSSPFGT